MKTNKTKRVKGWAVHWEASDEYWVFPTKERALRGQNPHMTKVFPCTITYSRIFSSGCSCRGDAHTKEIDKKTTKLLQIDENTAYKIGLIRKVETTGKGLDPSPDDKLPIIQ